jgi:ATP/maltotriose-dependent transcriptional regulator MalT
LLEQAALWMKTFSNHDVLLGLSGIVDHLYDYLAQDRWFRFDTQTRELSASQKMAVKRFVSLLKG